MLHAFQSGKSRVPNGQFLGKFANLYANVLLTEKPTTFDHCFQAKLARKDRLSRA